MAFEKLQGLGEEKFSKILNTLIRGESAAGLARIIQGEWGDFVGIPEKTLTQQLNRLRLAAAEGVFGHKMALQIAQGATPQVKALEHISVSAITRMEELADIQKSRVTRLMEKEKVLLLTSNLPMTNEVLRDYKDLLKDIQKMRFDLGLDEFKGPISGMRGVSKTVTLPDGTQLQQQVFEAANIMESVFDRRKVPSVNE